MTLHLLYSGLIATRTILAYIDPNTVHTVFSGIIPMLIAGAVTILAVFIWPLVFMRRRLGKWLRGGSKLRWLVLLIAILILLAGIALSCVLVFL